jgi:hypothetical protein
MRIEIINPKEIVVVQEKRQTFNSLTIERIIDFVEQKKVIVFLKEIPDPIIVWEGEEYDSKREWTKNEVAQYVKRLYSDV